MMDTQQRLRREFETEALPHLDALYANALRLTRSPADADDLVQEAVLRAYRFFERFERGTNMKAWLLRIQYNAFINRYRRSVRERDITDSMLHEPTGEDVISRETLSALTDPVGTALRPMVAKEIGEALDQLPEDHRMIVMLADVEELSYKEIAEVLGCPIGTVMSRLHRARRSLRAHLVATAAQHGLGLSASAASAPAEPPEPSALAETVSLAAYRRDRSSH